MRTLLVAVCLFGMVTSLSQRAVADDTAAHSGSDHAAEGAHGGGEGPESQLLKHDIPLAVWTAAVFLTVFGILWRFAWGPLSKALDDRERYRQEMLDKAESARADAERMLAEHRSLMAKAADDVRGILDEARRDAEVLGTSIVEKAQKEAEASKERAERDIATARDQALAEIWTKTADLAVNVAGRVLSREIGPDEHRRLVESAMDQLSIASSNGSGN